jgi:hypothetical protein
MAVGLPAKTTYADGDVFSASDINDTNGTLNLVGQTTNFYAGKNKIINGDMGIWQRGTSFSNPASGYSAADRWRVSNLTNPTTKTISRETFTPGTAPVAGYESQFFMRSTLTTKGSSTGSRFQQRIEDVRTFAGQTATLSFWVKTDANRTNNVEVTQYFGIGGSADVTVLSSTNFSSTTAWTRFSFTLTVPSISGKTLANGNFLVITIGQENTDGCVFDIWGVQLEAGSVATAFQTATGTIQGELAACQRYYYRINNGSESTFPLFGYGAAFSTTLGSIPIILPTTMRIKPTVLDFPTVGTFLQLADPAGSTAALTALTSNSVLSTTNSVWLEATVGSGLTQNRAYFLRGVNSTSAYLGISAEL